MKDDAVAPVIAVMLILAAVAMVFAVFNGVYIPSLKQAAEIEHLQNVESSFQRFSSDIERAVADRRDGTALSEAVPLGGGDIFFNPLRSAGSLVVMNESDPVYFLTLETETGTVRFNGTMVTISYDPVGNFWQDQGYRWQYGYLNVTKYGTKQSPLSYSRMIEVNNEFGTSGSPLAGFAGSLGSVEGSRNSTQLPVYDAEGNVTSYSPRDGNCSTIAITAVTLSASPDHPFVSGNGFGRLELGTQILANEKIFNLRSITIGSNREPFGNATVKTWNESFSALQRDYCYHNLGYLPDPDNSAGNDTYIISQQVSPVNVTLRIVSIGIGAM